MPKISKEDILKRLGLLLDYYSVDLDAVGQTGEYRKKDDIKEAKRSFCERILASADVASHVLPQSEKAMIPISDPNMDVEPMVLITTASEAEQLSDFANSIEPLDMSFTLTSGASYATRGTIELENYETDTGRTTIQMLPEEDWVLTYR